MFENIISKMDGISIYGVISICIFFGFFTVMILWAAARKKNYLNQMGALPLDSGEIKKDSTEKIQR
jgi:hypothetical protein